MPEINDALQQIDNLRLSEKTTYRRIAKHARCDRSTLSRRHRGVQVDISTKNVKQRKVAPQQEDDLVHAAWAVLPVVLYWLASYLCNTSSLISVYSIVEDKWACIAASDCVDVVCSVSRMYNMTQDQSHARVRSSFALRDVLKLLLNNLPLRSTADVALHLQ